ncbi:MAG: M14 family zinc carboxypeptidase [Acutalibacteraceae bacterium]|nr:M14 family zinc carboxypeptidase [Oscillospiraceae bacterium]
MLDFSGGFNYDISRLFVEKLTEKYDFLRSGVIGRTYTGRGIFSLSLGNELNSTLIIGGVHGCEWLTCLVIYKYIETLCRSVAEDGFVSSVRISALMNKFGVTFVPCLNPDGTEIAVRGLEGAGNMRHITEKIPCDDYSRWNANSIGVDLNHNFDAEWKKERLLEIENGILSSAPRQFGGFSPESEPETRAVTELCRRKKFRTAAAFHSQGEEIYCAFNGKEPAKSQMMAKILACSCGYKTVENSGLASYAGFKDWFISEFSKPAFTFEIGRGENPLPLSDLERIYSSLEEAMTLLLLM